MKEPIDPEDQKVLLPMLRAFFGWDQKQLALHIGLAPSTIRRYEKGEPMTRKSFQQLLERTGFPLALVETCFLPAIRAGRLALQGKGPLQAASDGAAGLDEALAEARQATFAALLAELSGNARVPAELGPRGAEGS